MIATTRIDPDGIASRFAAEGSYALGVGDTLLASDRYLRAGEQIETSVRAATTATEKQLARFVAASQYYQGGHYRRAYELARKIDEPKLPAEARRLFAPFLREAKTRAKPSYASDMRRRCMELWQANKKQDALELLKYHPYILEFGPLAILRSSICEDLGQWRASAAFLALAMRAYPNDPGLMMFPAGLPLRLAGQGRLAEAWEYVTYHLELCPTAVTHMIASVVSFYRGSEQTGEEREKRYLVQARHFDEAWQQFRELPERIQREPDVREVMELAFDRAAMGLLRLGEKDRALRVAEDGVRFAPNRPALWTVKGFIEYPSAVGLKSFQKAADMPGVGYIPFVYFAHDATNRGDYAAAAEFCSLAISRRPRGTILAALYGWLASLRHHLGADVDEVEGLFRKAMEATPGEPRFADAYEMYQQRRAEGRLPDPPSPPLRDVDDLAEVPDFINGEELQPLLKGRVARRVEGIFAGST